MVFEKNNLNELGSNLKKSDSTEAIVDDFSENDSFNNQLHNQNSPQNSNQYAEYDFSRNSEDGSIYGFKSDFIPHFTSNSASQNSLDSDNEIYNISSNEHFKTVSLSDLEYEFLQKDDDVITLKIKMKNIIEYSYSLNNYTEFNLYFKVETENNLLKYRLSLIDLHDKVGDVNMEYDGEFLKIMFVKEIPIKWPSLVNIRDPTKICNNFIRNNDLYQNKLTDDCSLDEKPFFKLNFGSDCPNKRFKNKRFRNFPLLFDKENSQDAGEYCYVLDNDNLNFKQIVNAKVGYTGLDNLGNTCFMNTTLQCLSNTPELRDYFLSKDFEKDLNKQNPFGSNCEFAIGFYNLVNELWNGQHVSYSPAKFKKFISKKMNQFSDSNQHDALEYMEQFLDFLHEDVNRVDRTVSILDSPLPKSEDEMTDKELADEMWARHRKRHDSIIIDLFYGQYKSHLTCPVCAKSSITFDPFLYLPVPLPKANCTYEIFYYSLNYVRKPIKLLINGSQDLKSSAILKLVSEKCGIKPQNLCLLINEILNPICFNYKQDISLNFSECLLSVFQLIDPSDCDDEIFNFVVHQRLLNPENNLSSHIQNNLSVGDNLNCQEASYFVNKSIHYRRRQLYNKNNYMNYTNYTNYTNVVGCPFMISITRKQLNYTYLYKILNDRSKHSVDLNKTKCCNENDLNFNSDKDLETPTVQKDYLGLEFQSLKDHSGTFETDKWKNVLSTMYNKNESFNNTESSIHLNKDLLNQNGIVQKKSSEYQIESDSDCFSNTKSNQMSTLEGVLDKKYNINKKITSTQPTQNDENTLANFLIYYSNNSKNEVNFNEMNEISPELNENEEEFLNKIKNCKDLVMVWKNGLKDNYDVIIETKELDHSLDISEYEKVTNEQNTITLDDCLKVFTDKEVLSLEDSWHCPKCKKPQEACKQLTLWRLPSILIIQLKRFSYKHFTRNKIDKFIEFPLYGLDLNKFCSKEVFENTNGNSIYDLYAIVNHFGGIYCGHYTAVAKCMHDNQQLGWRVFDDYNVEDIDENSIVTRNAYLLFYRLRKDENMDTSTE